MRTTLSILIAILLCIPYGLRAEDVNIGFVQGLWYSSEPLFADVPTRVYVALRNNTPHDLTGTVRFTDNGKRIGSSEVSALSGRLVETWIDWTPTSGEHVITASLSDATLHIIGGGTKTVAIESILAEDALTIDADTDKDGIGNTVDTDDDGDTISDTDEKTRGTNPLVKNPVPVSATEKSEVTTPQQSPQKVVTEESFLSEEERGLEQFVGAGATDSFLANLTDKVENTKQTLDTYRENRNAAQAPEEVETAPKETTLGTYTENATITRSKIETKNSFLSSFVSGIAALLQKVWTFLLWIASRTLAYPALVELGILVGILLLFYRIARRFGRRPNY